METEGVKEAKGKEEIEKDVEEEEEFMDQFGNIKEDKIDDDDDVSLAC